MHVLHKVLKNFISRVIFFTLSMVSVFLSSRSSSEGFFSVSPLPPLAVHLHGFFFDLWRGGGSGWQNSPNRLFFTACAEATIFFVRFCLIQVHSYFDLITLLPFSRVLSIIFLAAEFQSGGFSHCEIFTEAWSRLHRTGGLVGLKVLSMHPQKLIYARCLGGRVVLKTDP